MGLILFSTIVSGQAKRTITPVMNPGEQYIFKNTIISDIHEDGVRAINQHFSTSWFLRIVGRTADGELKIRATYLKINQRTEHLFTRDVTGFNSDDFKEFVAKSTSAELVQQNGLLRKLGEGMIGKSFTIYLNPDWTVYKVTGVDTLIETALDNLGDEDPALALSFGKTTRATINNEEIGRIFENAFAYVSDDEVGVGDKWTKDNHHHVGALRVDYTLKSATATELDIAVSSATFTNNDVQATYTRKGSIVLDPNTGLPLRTSIKDDMKGGAGNITRLVVRTTKNEFIKK